MSTLILYQTSTGATKQYAEWLQAELSGSEISTYEAFDSSKLSNYERIIFCMPTYGGKITPKEYLEDNWDVVKNKDVYLLVVGMVPEGESWSQRSYKTISEEVRSGLRGYAKLPGISTKKPGEKTGWLERTMSKLFLGINPEETSRQQEVKREDLDRFLKMIKE